MIVAEPRFADGVVDEEQAQDLGGPVGVRQRGGPYRRDRAGEQYRREQSPRQPRPPARSELLSARHDAALFDSHEHESFRLTITTETLTRAATRIPRKMRPFNPACVPCWIA
jgi:hypothetical protein